MNQGACFQAVPAATGGRALPLLGWLCAFAFFPPANAGETVDGALRFYQDSQFVKAKRIAAKHRDKPLGQLVFHLCQVHDVKNQNLGEGLAGLQALYRDPAVRKNHPQVWAEGALAYARLIQLFQIRKRQPEYAQVDIRKVYRDILAAVPKDLAACTAVMYLAESYLHTGNKNNEAQGFALVEKFLAAYRGAAKDTIPVHLYIESFYINLREDYAKSFTHLKTAYELGIMKDVLRRITLFRMARMCDIKLGQPTAAENYYRKFLQLYPNSRRTPVAQRYLQEMKSRQRKREK